MMIHRLTGLLVLICVCKSGFSQESNSLDLVKQIRPSVVTIRVNGRDGDEIAMGTGFVIDAKGLIATNFHVIGEGRPFEVEAFGQRKLAVVKILASDRAADLAIIEVDTGDTPLPALSLGQTSPDQGANVMAFGNPLGLEDSVVAGIVSAVRKVDGRELIQLAIPIEQGNSGGPLVDSDGEVIGIINMKSAVDDNLGFAIPIDQLQPLLDAPNPVAMDRWVRLGRINEQRWKTLFGATWQERGGLIKAQGYGKSFGGRSLCLSTEPMPELPYEIAVQVRLDDESGAAGIAFHSDGNHRHYGFYPSSGQLRLTCFKGPFVNAWEILEQVESKHYLPGQWNRIRVRIEKDQLQCFVNGHMVVQSRDVQFTKGSFGLVKFRGTQPEFKQFRYGRELSAETMSNDAAELLAELFGDQTKPRARLTAEQFKTLGRSSSSVIRDLNRRVSELNQQAEHLQKIARDIEVAPTIAALRDLMADDDLADKQLFRGALLIAKLDNPDIDVDAYEQRLDQMASEIQASMDNESASAKVKREALHRYLFEENGFHGGRMEYYHAANSHMNSVIDDREGLPITLSILYMELGKRIGMKVDGIGLPGHFVVKHVINRKEHQLVDVFERGELLSDNDAKLIVASYANRALRDADLEAQTSTQVLGRVINNLIGVAGKQQDAEAIYRYCEALVAINPESADYRMLRSRIRAMTDRIDAAIEDLDWILDNKSSEVDQHQVLQLREALIRRQNQ